MIRAIAIIGIHTGIGKTVASAVLATAMGADYWKPVQAGTEQTDSEVMRSLLPQGSGVVHPEAVVLQHPLSPHTAAEIENVVVDYSTFTWPVTARTLLVETAGGLLSPMYAGSTMADFVCHYRLPALLVSANYLGSINHTLMTIEVLQKRQIPLLGIVISGAANTSSESFIERYTGHKIIARIPQLQPLDHASVAAAAINVRRELSGSPLAG